jgi:hypothetical protein
MLLWVIFHHSFTPVGGKRTSSFIHWTASGNTSKIEESRLVDKAVRPVKPIKNNNDLNLKNSN